MMNDDIIIDGVGSFHKPFVQSMSKEEWIDYMKGINPKFKHAEEVWMKANPAAPKASTPPKKKKEDVPDSDSQL